MRPFGAGGVQVHARDAGRGEPQPHEVLELLRAEAAHALGLLAAHAARGGDRFLVTAVMAAEGGWRLVHGERDGAVRAVAHVAAGGTLQVGREPPAVEEQDHLLPAPERIAHRLIQRRGPGNAARLGHALGAPQVHHLDRRQRAGIDPLGQLEARHAALGREVQGLERGRGAAENDTRALESGAHQRHVAGVIARDASLLVAGLVLFIHHDRAQPLDGREHGRAWPDSHAPLTAP